MTYAGIQMFMEKLNQLLNSNDIPLFNNPEIICQKPQFQLLYDELDSMIQTLFIHQHQDLQQVNDLKKRFIYASEEAQHIVDLFLSGVHIRNTTQDFPMYEDFSPSLNLDGVRRSFKSIEMEFMSLRIDSIKMDSFPRPETTLNHSAAAPSSFTRSPQGSKKVLDENVVGFDCDAELIRDKLVEDQKKVHVVSIVGMGGIGKTTLAAKVFNDGYVKHHFHVRVWVTVSQTYDKRDVLMQILESIRAQLYLKKVTDSALRELVHKNLMGKRYLIVIDDIWHTETWDNLKLFFPHDNTGSRILLTSRLTEVAKHATPVGLIHHLGYLNKERSWELLCKKVFSGNECPEWSIEPGMQIVESCQGLPLAVIIIAGVLANEAWSEKFWVEVAYRAGSYIVDNQNGCLGILALSYNHLPLHLRECFLYLGGFPEDYKFKVHTLTWLWVSEGFIQQAGNLSLEDTAEGYLMDLIDRNLVTVANRSDSDGAVKACKVHDLVRELCLKIAKEEGFFLQAERLITAKACKAHDLVRPPYKPVRMFIDKDIYAPDLSDLQSQSLRSILCFSDFSSLSDDIAKYFRSFLLLRVLNLQNCRLDGFPKDMELLVHLRYLAIWIPSKDFPSSICKIWSLQTIICISDGEIVLPSNISSLVNLRHLHCYHASGNIKGVTSFFLPSIEKPMNLQTISNVMLGDGVDNFHKCFPYIKELRSLTCLEEEYDFKSLTYLEKLKLDVIQKFIPVRWEKSYITFPATLKTLILENCDLPWSDMSILQSLPNLEVLKLKYDAFKGSCWNTDEQVFPQLKFLKLEWLDIEMWEAYSTSFPCLERLEIFFCDDLKEIPLEIGYIPTLELLKIMESSGYVGESVRRIQEEQHDLGNYGLKIELIPVPKIVIDCTGMLLHTVTQVGTANFGGVV